MTAALSTRLESLGSSCSEKLLQKPKILIATIDPLICNELVGTLSGFSVNMIWAKSMDYVKTLLRKERLAGCLCGLWLQDGTFRDLVRHIRRARVEIPVIITSGPGCSVDYAQLLGAMNIGALGFLPHPYCKSDLERLLNFSLDAPA